MAVLEHAHEDLLHEVFGRRAAARETQEEMEKALVVALEELAQKGNLPRPHRVISWLSAGGPGGLGGLGREVTAAIP